MKFLITCLLFIAINAYATQVFVEIKTSSADITTETGEAFFGSYLYALISSSTTPTDLYFTGDQEIAITIFSDVVANDPTIYLESIKYVMEGDYILALIVDNYGYGYYSVVISRR